MIGAELSVDHDAVIVSVVGVIGVLITTIGAVAINLIQRLTTKVDGRLTELLELTRKSSHAEGMKDEKESQ